MRRKKAGIITKIVIIALVVYAAVSLINMRARIGAALIRLDEAKQQVAENEATNQELQFKIDHKDDEEIIADVARDDLNLVEPGEKVFIESGD